MKKIFLSILVAAASLFGASNASAQIVANFTTEPMAPEFAEMAKQVIDQQTTNPDAANKVFSKLFNKVKKNKEQATAVGKFFLDNKIYICAKQCANAAYTADPAYVPGLMLGVGVNLLRNNYGEAGAKLDEILMNDPDNIEALRLSARVYKYVNPYAAIDILGQIIAREPENIDAQKQLGDIYYEKLENYPASIENYGKYFDLKKNLTKDDLRACENYLISTMVYGQFDKTMAFIPRVEPLIAGDKNMVVDRARFVSQMESYDFDNAAQSVAYIAEKQYDDSLYIDMDYDYASRFFSDVQENYDRAIECEKARFALNDKKIEVLKEVANLYRRKGSPAEGLSYYEKYIELLGDKADVADRLALGMYYSSVKDAAETVEEKMALIEKADPLFEAYMADPEYATKYQGPFYRARLWITDNGAAEEKPKEYFEKTIEVINSLDEDAQLLAATQKKTALQYILLYYAKSGQTDKCKPYVQGILEIDPEDGLALQVKNLLKL